MKMIRVSLILVAFATLIAVQCIVELDVAAQEIGADALVAAYGFNEGGGTTTTDASGNLLTGDISGATWSVAGHFGGALSFDGSGDWVTINDAPPLDLSTGMTIQAWVFPTALSGWKTVVLKETPGGLAFALYAHDNAPRPAAYVNIGGSEVAAIGSAQLPLNTWTHLAATYNGATLRLFVNGSPVGSTAVSGAIVGSLNPLRIGGNSVWGEYFTGRIDEVRIHNRELLQSEIQALMSTPVDQEDGFSFIIYNNPVTVGLSDSATYNLGINPTGGFTGAVVPSVSGLPPDTVAAVEPVGGPPHPGPFALTITTSPTTPPGTYLLTLTGVAGALTASTSLTLIVLGNPDFQLTVEPNSLILTQGQNGVANFQVKELNSFSQVVTLDVTGLPSEVAATFTPPALIPTGTGTVQFNVSALTPPGVYPLFLTAVSNDGNLTRQAAFTLTVKAPSGGGSWRQLSMGDTGAMYYGVLVGDVGNTGKNRVYGTAGSGLVYEYSHNGTSWSFSQVPVGVPADGEMHNGAIGPARNDGINRLYIAAAMSGRVYELSWLSGSWQVEVMATLNGATDVVIGAGRNDGILRMYVTWMSGSTEFTWNGTSWTQVTMSGNESGWVHGNDLGPGRNDGVNRIYTANQGNGEVYEYTWTGSSWSKVLVGATNDTRNLKLGKGRNDGLFRVYTASGDSNAYEYTWTGVAWQAVSMGSAGVGGIKVHSHPAAARGDGLERVYVASTTGVHEYQWNGTTWQGVLLGNAVAYMYGLDVGDGLNNGTTQVYGSSYDGNVYVFDWTPTTATVPVPNVVGLTQQQATNTITGAGLTAGPITSEFNATVQAGLVIRQSPTAGTPVPPGSGVGFVLSLGPAPSASLSINDVSVTEGNAGTISAMFTVTLLPASTQPVTVAYATANGTATAGQDYVAASGTVTFAPGETTKPLSILVNGDLRDEDNETFVVNLSNPSNAVIGDAQGVGTILDNDPLPSLSISDAAVTEGNTGTTTATFTVTLSPVSGRTVSVNWATANGTAVAPDDYVAASGTLTFAAGTTSQTLSVSVRGETTVEPNETFVVNLSGPINATITDAQGLGNILNDDAAGGATIAVDKMRLFRRPRDANHAVIQHGGGGRSAFGLRGIRRTIVGGTDGDRFRRRTYLDVGRTAEHPARHLGDLEGDRARSVDKRHDHLLAAFRWLSPVPYRSNVYRCKGNRCLLHCQWSKRSPFRIADNHSGRFACLCRW